MCESITMANLWISQLHKTIFQWHATIGHDPYACGARNTIGCNDISHTIPLILCRIHIWTNPNITPSKTHARNHTLNTIHQLNNCIGFVISLRPPHPQWSLHRHHEPQAPPHPLLCAIPTSPKSKNSSIWPSFWFLVIVYNYHFPHISMFSNFSSSSSPYLCYSLCISTLPIIMFQLWIPSPFCVYTKFVPSLFWWAYIHVRLETVDGDLSVKLGWCHKDKKKGVLTIETLQWAHHEHTLPPNCAHLP